MKFLLSFNLDLLTDQYIFLVNFYFYYYALQGGKLEHFGTDLEKYMAMRWH